MVRQKLIASLWETGEKSDFSARFSQHLDEFSSFANQRTGAQSTHLFAAFSYTSLCCVLDIQILNYSAPLVYQTTTSLGLAQVQLHSPKVVVATGAAARALKNGIPFLPKIKSSSPIKYEYVRPLSHRLRAQSIKFGIVQVDVRTSTYEHLRLLR